MSVRRFVVHGVVQGVGFRWYVRARARALALTGWVRNLPGGTVEVIAAGEPDRLAELRLALAEGPPGARVDRLAESAAAGAQALPGPFEIR